jgi:hypothetical protein
VMKPCSPKNHLLYNFKKCKYVQLKWYEHILWNIVSLIHINFALNSQCIC